jgi:hypothetical protein
MKSHYPGCISDEECKCQDHDDDLDCAASSTKTREQYESQIADLVAMNDRLRTSLIKALETLAEISVGRKIDMQSRDREIEELREASQAVVDRWETPLWKDAPSTAGFIHRLRTLLPANATMDACRE